MEIMRNQRHVPLKLLLRRFLADLPEVSQLLLELCSDIVEI